MGVGATRSEPCPGGSRASPKEATLTIEVQFLIPTHDNAKIPFDAVHDAVFEHALANAFNGFSVLPGAGSGGWRAADGTMILEPHRVYVVAVDGLIAVGKKVLDVAMFAKSHYRQDAIYLRYLGVAEILT